MYVVAIEIACGDKVRRVSGLALCANGKPPLVFTIAEISLHPPPVSVCVSFITSSGTNFALNAKVVATSGIKAAETAFKLLSHRGWRCGTSDVTHFAVHLLRAEPFPKDFPMACLKASHGYVPKAAWNVRPGEEMSGAMVQIISAPFGAMPSSSLSRLLTEGVIVSISEPPGILMLDARRLDGSTGGAIVRTEGKSCAGGGEIIACLAPRLRPSSRESVAFSLAVPLAFIFDSIIDDPSMACHLMPEEFELFVSAPSVAQEEYPSVLQRRINVRRSVALLWLETTGSWASGIIVSRAGHILTCAHFLTGHSWVETPPDPDGKDDKSKRSRPRPPPKTCRGRVATLGSDGRFVDMPFEADVLHIFNGCLDVALLAIRRNKGNEFVPIAWPAPSIPLEAGREVWAVGHGLFGLGTPWIGPAITRGHVTKVTYGEVTRRLTVVQTSAAVHRGCSGGALVDACNGELIGLVTTNVKHQDGTVMPHVNFSLPVTLLSPLRDFLANPDQPSALSKLIEDWKFSAADEQEQSLWRLEPEFLELPSPVEERRQMALDLMEKLAKEADMDEAALGSGIAVDHADAPTSIPHSKL